jgi:cytosine/adenosine deaminase-related metal-dependent hydrolase
MFFQGISGVGDISNTDLTVEIKKLSKISYFTFIEVFGFHPSRAGKAIALAFYIREKFSEASLSSSIVPHSPYSVSDQLFEKIDHLPDSECSILTIHNQEDAEENRFFRSGDGPILDHLINNLGIDTSHWYPSGKNSLETILPKLPTQKPLLLVHNTFSTIQDIIFLKNNHPADKTFIVLCPNSNLFISNQLPAVNLFRSEKLQICIGTELITLQHQFPDVRLEEMLIWACANGANALGMKDRLGTIEVGKKPGIVLISDIDLKNLKFTSGSWVKRLA